MITIVLAVTDTFLLCTHGSLDSLAITLTTLAWGAVTAFTLTTYTLLPARPIVACGAGVVVTYGLLVAGVCIGLVDRVWRFRTTWTSDAVFAIFSTVVLGAAVASTVFLWGMNRIGPVKASFTGGLEPITAIAFSTLAMGSSCTDIDIIGMALIVGAVVTISVVGLPRVRHVT